MNLQNPTVSTSSMLGCILNFGGELLCLALSKLFYNWGWGGAQEQLSGVASPSIVGSRDQIEVAKFVHLTGLAQVFMCH